MTVNSLVSPAQSYTEQQEILIQESGKLHEMYKTVDSPLELSINQWAQWFAVTMSFKPDLIIELGRAVGNSTCVFTEAANLLGDCRVISLCLSDIWQKSTRPKLEKYLPSEWFDRLDARTGNILIEDAKAIVGTSKRVLVCWDAHGFDVAEYVLSQLLPAIWPNQHLIIMHDISDTRYAKHNPSYGENGVWRGGLVSGTDASSVLYLGSMVSSVAQSLCAYDFTNRNGIKMHSADESLHNELSESQKTKLVDKLGDMFSLDAHWWYWSLNEILPDTKIHFPKAPKYDHTEESNILGPLIPTPANISRLQERIIQMEASPFWKLRSLFRGPRKN